jgi:inorganic pyrophosphatase
MNSSKTIIGESNIMFRISKEERSKANRPLHKKVLESVVDIQKNTTIKVLINKTTGTITIQNPTHINVIVNFE